MNAKYKVAKNSNGVKILLSGGGTMGSVTPLIAVYQKIKNQHPDAEFLFIGTKFGPEKKAVEGYKINFKAITAGRWRRYFSWRNFIDPFKVLVGFFQSLKIILQFKPDVIMVTGGFVGVPVAWAGWLLQKPILMHQLDVLAGLANKLVANIAKKITVSFAESKNDFNKSKVTITGNPIRPEFFECQVKKSHQFFNLKNDLPVLLIMGGGTGAEKINRIVERSLKQLTDFCQIIHITGLGKKIKVQADNYYQYEFLTNEMPEALCVADLVVSRAGLATLSELAVLAKPTILIPIPNANQESNAAYFQKNNAVVVLSQDGLTDRLLVDMVKEVIKDKVKSKNLSHNISKMMNKDGADKVAKILLQIAK